MKKRRSFKSRAAGILLPVSGLPSAYGIGSLGKEAFCFVDFLVRAKQSVWQVLPAGPTSYGDSPYQSFSAFAGNPYYIDLDLLAEEGLLSASDLDGSWGGDPSKIDYALLYERRFPVLRRAFANSRDFDTPEYVQFCSENAPWLEDYCLYMALKTKCDGKEWSLWPENARMPNEADKARWAKELASELAFWRFCQFRFFAQWQAVKTYANQRNIRIVGDLPIYVALDSADVWANKAQFQLDAEGCPTDVAGVPPDMFSATGQLWGNPLYDWDKMEADGFSWWRQRMAHTAKLYDVIRIDHFIGVVRYYAIPAGSKTAQTGEYRPGPGKKLTDAIQASIGRAEIIAEDLGVVIPAVRTLLKKTGFPGMKVLEFAFDGGTDNEHLPCHYTKNMVVYAGTHDNQTLTGFFEAKKQRELRFAKDYLHVKHRAELPGAVIRAAYASVANLCIIQAQDWLGLDDRARMNLPATLGGNWEWRLLPEQLTPELAGQIAEMTEIYGREQVPASKRSGEK